MHFIVIECFRNWHTDFCSFRYPSNIYITVTGVYTFYYVFSQFLLTEFFSFSKMHQHFILLTKEKSVLAVTQKLISAILLIESL